MEDKKLDNAKSIIADQVRGEWEAIRNYEKAVDDLKSLDGDFSDVIDILNDIADEEEVHVGELEKAQAQLDNNVLDNITDGQEEAEEKISEPAKDLNYDTEVEESLKEDTQFFGDFMGDMLAQDKFAMLDIYCKNYFNKEIGKGLGVYNEKNYRYYKQRLLKKLAEINELSEEDKKLDWRELNKKYLTRYGILSAIKNGNKKPYDVFKKLLKAAGIEGWFLPESLNEAGLGDYIWKSRVNQYYEDVFGGLERMAYYENDDEVKECYYDDMESLFCEKCQNINWEHMDEIKEVSWYKIESYLKDHEQLFQRLYKAEYGRGIFESLNEEVHTDEVDEVTKYIEDIYDLRKSSIAKDGEYSLGNLVFKEARNKGYLDNLKELKNQLISKELSLEEGCHKSFGPFATRKEAADKVEELENSYRDDMVWKIDDTEDGFMVVGYSVTGKCYDFGEELKEEEDLVLIPEPTLDYEKLEERYLTNPELYDYKTKISRVAHDQAIVQPNGRFTINLVKESEAQSIVSRLQREDFVEEVHTTPSGKYDFSHYLGTGTPNRYFTIQGKIKIEPLTDENGNTIK